MPYLPPVDGYNGSCLDRTNPPEIPTVQIKNHFFKGLSCYSSPQSHHRIYKQVKQQIPQFTPRSLWHICVCRVGIPLGELQVWFRFISTHKKNVVSLGMQVKYSQVQRWKGGEGCSFFVLFWFKAKLARLNLVMLTKAPLLCPKNKAPRVIIPNTNPHIPNPNFLYCSWQM